MSKVDWKPSLEQKRFILHYAKAIEGGNAALFAGAGLSRAAGYVDWRALLKEIAAELRLDIHRETDLIALAQYHLKEKRNRSRVNQLLIDELTKTATHTQAHTILARLPIDTVWTTNYDPVLERAFDEAGKTVDIKITGADLAQSRHGRDVTIYKMDGCITQPEDAVVTKDDYESYDSKRSFFSDILKGDLIGKTFLFLGFSFSDPNIDHIFGCVRALLGTNQREHFCVMRRSPRPSRMHGKQKADFEYERRKADLQHADLLRLGIETLWIDEYDHLEPLLRSLAAFVHRKSVFVSGAPHDPAPLGSLRLDQLARELGSRLMNEDFRLVSGFGLELGEQTVLGALSALCETIKGVETDRVLVKPFPRAPVASDQQTQNTKHREDLLSRVGSVVVVAGNKPDLCGGVGPSEGVNEEVAIALRLGKFIIPVGASGHAAHQIWSQAMASPERYLPGLMVQDELRILGDGDASNETLLDAVFAILHAAEKAVSAQYQSDTTPNPAFHRVAQIPGS